MCVCADRHTKDDQDVKIRHNPALVEYEVDGGSQPRILLEELGTTSAQRAHEQCVSGLLLHVSARCLKHPMTVAMICSFAAKLKSEMEAIPKTESSPDGEAPAAEPEDNDTSIVRYNEVRVFPIYL